MWLNSHVTMYACVCVCVNENGKQSNWIQFVTWMESLFNMNIFATTYSLCFSLSLCSFVTTCWGIRVILPININAKNKNRFYLNQKNSSPTANGFDEFWFCHPNAVASFFFSLCLSIRMLSLFVVVCCVFSSSSLLCFLLLLRLFKCNASARDSFGSLT